MKKYELPVIGMIILLALLVAGCGQTGRSEAPAQNQNDAPENLSGQVESDVADTKPTLTVETEPEVEPTEEPTMATTVEPATAIELNQSVVPPELPRPENQLVEGEYHWSQLLGRDSIPPIYKPDFTNASSAPYADDELVIGVEINGEAKAYAIGPLNSREMVNDTIGGTPVLVTW